MCKPQLVIPESVHVKALCEHIPAGIYHRRVACRLYRLTEADYAIRSLIIRCVVASRLTVADKLRVDNYRILDVHLAYLFEDKIRFLYTLVIRYRLGEEVKPCRYFVFDDGRLAVLKA